MSHWKNCIVLLAAATAAAIVLIGCAENDVLKIFTEKGLVLLQPARTYVAVGGLFTVASGAKPAYIDADPSDPILTDSSSRVSDCTVVFGDETHGQSMAFNAAMNALAKVVPWAAGLQAKSGASVHLATIISPCARLNARALTALVNEKTNQPWIVKELHKPRSPRVYVVLEVDSTKTLTVTADSSVALEASFQGQGSLPACSTPSIETGSESGAAGNDPASSKRNESDDIGSKSGTSRATPGTKTQSADRAAGEKGMGNTGGTGSKDAGGSSGIAVGACVTGLSSLTLKSDVPVPFAVRLAQVFENPPNSGLLDIKNTGFKFPAESLGSGSDLERATAKLEADLLQGGFERGDRSSR